MGRLLSSPEGGESGGNLVVAGPPDKVAACALSYTGQFLKKRMATRKARAGTSK